MDLFNSIARPCVLLKDTTVSGNEGGKINVWTEEMEFINRFTLSSSGEKNRADNTDLNSFCACLIDADIPLKYNDFFRDRTTGETFRVTSNPDEKQIPAIASPMLAGKKFFTAEKTVLPE